MARPKKIVAPVEVVDDAITISKTPITIDGVVVEATVEVVPELSERAVKVEALSKLFPRAPFSEYDDALVDALFAQHVGTTVRPE